METKFTKGPWAKDKRNESLIGSNGKAVLTYDCGLATGGGKKDEYVANSYLIAAAPDMYAMLEEVTKLRDGDWSQAGDWLLDNTDDLIELLKKARGE